MTTSIYTYILHHFKKSFSFFSLDITLLFSETDTPYKLSRSRYRKRLYGLKLLFDKLKTKLY